jgi:hypothetical protein
MQAITTKESTAIIDTIFFRLVTGWVKDVFIIQAPLKNVYRQSAASLMRAVFARLPAASILP